MSLLSMLGFMGWVYFFTASPDFYFTLSKNTVYKIDEALYTLPSGRDGKNRDVLYRKYVEMGRNPSSEQGRCAYLRPSFYLDYNLIGGNVGDEVTYYLVANHAGGGQYVYMYFGKRWTFFSDWVNDYPMAYAKAIDLGAVSNAYIPDDGSWTK